MNLWTRETGSVERFLYALMALVAFVVACGVVVNCQRETSHREIERERLKREHPPIWRRS